MMTNVEKKYKVYANELLIFNKYNQSHVQHNRADKPLRGSAPLTLCKRILSYRVRAGHHV